MRQGERQWFQARLRWAVMEAGRGLDHWLEAEHIFQSDSREAAFAEALRIGHSQEYVGVPDRGCARRFEHRLAEVVYLEEKGPAPVSFEVSLGTIKATESLGFEHEFKPDKRMPTPAF
ncbi:MAG TPA: hypothetical protein VMU80_02965 [Bryobacteraceae bacterium]|nr:hypothetical protein [Bryobacteraceae bacterium]